MHKFILILSFLFLVLQEISFANLSVKMSARGVCFAPEHPSYEKVKNYIKTFNSIEECIKAGGILPQRMA